MAAKEETGRHKTWIRDFDFLVVMIGHGIGFGNVWRFPYVCYRNGGGAFLIPYVIAVLLLGIPLTLLEGCVGQFTSRGVIHAWRIVPLFSGLGYMLTVFSFVGKTAYSLLFAWVLYYLFSSMTSVLPWSHCNNPWNTPQCRESVAWNGSHSTNSSLVPENSTALTSNQSLVTMDPASEFWERKVLSVSEGINHPGTVKWDIALCLLLAWLLIYFCVWKGIRLTAKVSYVTSTMPYLLLIVLLIRGVTLEGSAEGLKFYLQPKWERLAKGQVWLDACIQVIYSYTLGGTIHTALGSCNKFHHNILKHYCIFAVVNSATSFLCGFVIFSVLGFMANRQGVSVDNVAESGPGLAFIVYPEALAQLPAPYVWSIVFFLMLAFVGIDSEFAGVKGFIISLSDLFSPRFSRTPYKEALSGVCCVTWFLLTLSMVTEGGIYVEQILEWYVGGRIRMVVLFLETFVISYCYGVNRFQKNVQFMLGYRIGPFFKVSWLLVIPGTSLVLLVVNIVSYPVLVYRRKSGVYYFPEWTQALGWFLALPGILCLPAVMIYKLKNTPGSLLQRLCRLMQPDFTEVQRQRDLGELESKDPDVFLSEENKPEDHSIHVSSATSV